MLLFNQKGEVSLEVMYMSDLKSNCIQNAEKVIHSNILIVYALDGSIGSFLIPEDVDGSLDEENFFNENFTHVLDVVFMSNVKGNYLNNTGNIARSDVVFVCTSDSEIKGIFLPDDICGYFTK